MAGRYFADVKSDDPGNRFQKFVCAGHQFSAALGSSGFVQKMTTCENMRVPGSILGEIVWKTVRRKAKSREAKLRAKVERPVRAISR
jgi:hypothetical protein